MPSTSLQLARPTPAKWYSIWYYRKGWPGMSITASEARRSLFPLIKKVNEDHDAIEIVSKHGNAVLVSAEDFAALREGAYLLRSPANARRLLKAYENALNGIDLGSTSLLTPMPQVRAAAAAAGEARIREPGLGGLHVLAPDRPQDAGADQQTHRGHQARSLCRHGQARAAQIPPARGLVATDR